MPKVSSLFKASATITLFFGIDKIVALIRQWIIIKQYGFSPEIDAFNVANNVPDLLAILISGGAFAVAFIPILSEYIHKKGSEEAWLLFSRVANSIFLLTASLSLIVAFFAPHLVGANFGIAPGFSQAQKKLVVDLMRLDLLATLLFSLSGLMIAALQSRKHFLLPALAPILYNLGQIFGAIVLTPMFHMGIYGLAYGVIFGAFLHMGIQIPGLIRHHYRWNMSLSLSDLGVRKVFRLMGPRIATVLFIQIIFLTRDNLASRLHTGAVTALTYGYFILQVPETLIGTAIATALLPTISQLAHHKDQNLFIETFERSLRVILTIASVVAVLSMLSLKPLISSLFNFSKEESQLLLWTSIAYLVGLTSQCLLEITTRAFYARQDAKTPFIVTFIRMALFIILSVFFFRQTGVIGLALIDSLTITVEVGLLLLILARTFPQILHLHQTLIRAFIGCLVAISIFSFIFYLLPLPILPASFIALLLAGALALFFIRNELRMLFRL